MRSRSRADRRTGTIEDVDHIVLLMMENRSFDHYFGSMNGVRGFADRFPIPVAERRRCSARPSGTSATTALRTGAPSVLAPQHNDTHADFALLRSASTPHLYPNAQEAWDHGRMGHWPQFKTEASMVYFQEADLPFQYALANAFTVVRRELLLDDRRHQSQPLLLLHRHQPRPRCARRRRLQRPGRGQRLQHARQGRNSGGYTWTTYPERLEDAGISWQIYQNEEREFFALNPLLGFRRYREANAASVPSVSPRARRASRRSTKRASAPATSIC